MAIVTALAVFVSMPEISQTAMSISPPTTDQRMDEDVDKLEKMVGEAWGEFASKILATAACAKINARINLTTSWILGLSLIFPPAFSGLRSRICLERLFDSLFGEFFKHCLALLPILNLPTDLVVGKSSGHWSDFHLVAGPGVK